jgi:hypothetical protein
MAPYETQFLNITFFVIVGTALITTLGVYFVEHARRRVPSSGLKFRAAPGAPPVVDVLVPPMQMSPPLPIAPPQAGASRSPFPGFHPLAFGPGQDPFTKEGAAPVPREAPRGETPIPENPAPLAHDNIFFELQPVEAKGDATEERVAPVEEVSIAPIEGGSTVESQISPEEEPARQLGEKEGPSALPSAGRFHLPMPGRKRRKEP